MNKAALAKTNVDKLQRIIGADSVQKQFQNAMAENSGPFVASLIDLYGSDDYLQKCDPAAVVREALKAAVLKLPINKSLGFAYIVPYKGAPQFQIGYKGLIQLAQRSGKCRTINARKLEKGFRIDQNILSGETTIVGKATSDEAQGYFAFFELINGFKKTLYMTTAEVNAHGKKYSPSFGRAGSPWKEHFDAMAIKTVLKKLLGVYGILSIEMQDAITRDIEENVQEEIDQNANADIIDISGAEEIPDPETPEA